MSDTNANDSNETGHSNDFEYPIFLLISDCCDGMESSQQDCAMLLEIFGGTVGWSDEPCQGADFVGGRYIVEYDCTSTITGGAGGDPHFKMLSGHWFDFHVSDLFVWISKSFQVVLMHMVREHATLCFCRRVNLTLD